MELSERQKHWTTCSARSRHTTGIAEDSSSSKGKTTNALRPTWERRFQQLRTRTRTRGDHDDSWTVTRHLVHFEPTLLQLRKTWTLGLGMPRTATKPITQCSCPLSRSSIHSSSTETATGWRVSRRQSGHNSNWPKEESRIG